MNNFNKIQPIEGYYFSNYLMNNKDNSGQTENGKFTISKIIKIFSIIIDYETVVIIFD